MDDVSMSGWFAVRCLFRNYGSDAGRLADGYRYEERITLWRAADLDDAIGKAEAEALRYAATIEEAPDLAGLTGTINMTENCVYVQNGAGGRLFLPIFPRDEIKVAGGQLRYAGATLEAGSPVALQGSEKDLQTLSDLQIELPEDCRSAQRYWMVAGD